MKKLYTLLCFLLIVWEGNGQVEMLLPKVPLMRELSHINIDNDQTAILRLTSKTDTLFKASSDESINLQITQILNVNINNLQAIIETDSTLSEAEKYKWLRGIDFVLKDFISAYSLKNIKGILLGDVIYAFEACMQLERQNQSIAPIVAKNEMEVGTLLINNEALKKNIGIQQCKDMLVLKQCERHPENTLKILKKQPNLIYADSLIVGFAFRNQEELYNYAANNDALAQKIQHNSHPLVKTISTLAKMSTGRMFFPFLDKLYRNELSMESVQNLIDQEHGYYKLLVKTQIEYAGRALQADTPLVMHVLTEKLREKAIEIYIDEINALHDEKQESVRFKKIDSLTPQELYYLCVLGEDEIYTSSYLGVYKRIFERLKTPRSDTLLNMVNSDFYKKFIKMAAGYNTLNDFLKRMSQADSDALMQRFVNDLAAKKTLEDAVDVANAFASITDEPLKKLIIQQTAINLKKADVADNKKERNIYNILYTVFLSADSSNKIDAAAILGIPPVFVMPYKLLQNANTNRINIQQFFYGDKDGMTVFSAFVSNFSNSNWRIVHKPEWVEVSSIKGIPITIYANKPLDELKDLDAQAQKNLCSYLDSLDLNPTVVLHRGHSYYLKSTIKQLATSAKLILLGSCGGYQSLNSVLDICPTAQIISSKQVGTGIINQGMINAITETLRQGRDLNWPIMWRSFEKQFGGQAKEKFDDYVPPHKNLGAIFIMAYNKAMEDN